MDTLRKTYFLDLDGTILKFQSQNLLDESVRIGNLGEAHKREELIDGAREFLDSINENDKIIITTARTEEYIGHTLKALEFLNVRYDNIVFNITSGPRIVVNDIKPPMTAGNNKNEIRAAYAVNVPRNSGDFSEHDVVLKEIEKDVNGN